MLTKARDLQIGSLAAAMAVVAREVVAVRNGKCSPTSDERLLMLAEQCDDLAGLLAMPPQSAAATGFENWNGAG